MTKSNVESPKIVAKAKWDKKTFGIIAGVLAIVGIIIIAISRAATTGPNLGFYMTSTNNNPGVNTQFDVKLYANTGTTPVKSISALLHYDPAVVRPDAVSSAPKADPLASPPVDGFDETLACGPANGCRTDTGSVAFALTNTGTSRRSGDSIYIGTVRFTALKNGSPNITYDQDVKMTGFINPDGTTQTTLDTRTIQNPTITVADTTPPSVPAGLSSPSKTMNSVNLSWTASTDDSGGSVSYKIYRNGTQVGTSTTNTYVDNGLTPSTTYSYTVSSYDSAGNNSVQSSPALSVTTAPDTQAPTAPGKPTGSSITMNSLTISWTASTDNVAVTGYKVLRNGTQVGTSATTSYTDSGLTPSTSYSYTIIAYDAANNNSTSSQATSVTTAADTQAPTTPATLTVTSPTNTSAALTWSTSTDNVAVTGYRVLRNGTQIATTAGNVTSYTNTGLTAGTYSYTVVAVDAANNTSQPTAAKSITIYGAADVDKDGIVSISDLGKVLTNYGRTGTGLVGDANGDGVVNITDIGLLLTYWGKAG